MIDLVGQTLTNVSLTNGALVASTATGTTTIHSTTPLTGTVEVSSDGHGGANISIVPASTTKPTLTVSQAKMMFYTPTSGDMLTGTSANMNGLAAFNWSSNSSLDITDLSPTAAKLTATAGTNTTTLGYTDGTHTGSLILGASLSQSHFTMASDGHGGTLITTH